MLLKFSKYQGTGNDFVMVDDRENRYQSLNTNQIKHICDRRFGIGADGLILLRNIENYDFQMVYFNSDGRESSMCGNGGRCILRFARDLGIQQREYRFLAVDGQHLGKVEGEEVSLQMGDVSTIKPLKDGALFLNTGSPHHVVFQDELPGNDFIAVARAIRENELYREEGVNVNFVKINDEILDMRTYERGVEDETLSCGTGVTAAALASNFLGKTKKGSVNVQTRGGLLKVMFKRQGDSYKDIWLIGPAERVFEGSMEV